MPRNNVILPSRATWQPDHPLALSEGNVELGGLLAIEAIRARRSLESDNVIHRALELMAVPTVKFGEQVNDIDIDGSGQWVAIAGAERLAVWDSATGKLEDLEPKTPIQSANAETGELLKTIPVEGRVFSFALIATERACSLATANHSGPGTRRLVQARPEVRYRPRCVGDCLKS